VKVRVWGSRGSVPTPGADYLRYGGNTSCVQVTLEDGTTVVLDAGTGIRPLGLELPRPDRPLHILLTHLHLDHIQGLMFFAPLFMPDVEVVIWGPSGGDAPLRDRIARYLSAPLTPVEIRELPCCVSFHECDTTEWNIGGATIRAQSVTHRGPTLGFRLEEQGQSLVYIPDHEPGLGAPLDSLEDEWISGLDLARGADVLFHDCQYTDAEYPHHLGWGHSPLNDALTFARRAHVRRLVAFHHDPLHSDDQLDQLAEVARERFAAVQFAAESTEIDLRARPAGARRDLG
jgi:phosphoribosyl 1,2-cyclic phosphodiesterase